MKIEIRNSIINNFKAATSEEIKESIISSIEMKEEITLPGLGVFFEVLWLNSDENSQQFIINTLHKSINKN